MKNKVFLIGPMAAGKSSVAKELSLLSGMKYYPMDEIKWYYRLKNGYDCVKSSNILASKGLNSLIDYRSRFFGLNEIRSIINEFDGIIEFGASDTHFNNLLEFSRIDKLFDPYPNIFLVLPYEDEQLSIDVLTKRIRLRYNMDPVKGPVINSYINKNVEFIRSVQNQKLAKHIIYTNDRTCNQIAQEIYYKCDFNSTNYYRVSGAS